MRTDSCEIGMGGIQQPVGFVGRQRRGHDENRSALSACEAIADRSKLRRGGSLTPGDRQAAGTHTDPRHIVRYIRRRDDKVRRRIVAIEMNEVLDHGQREMLRRVREPDARTRPSTAVAIRALTVERGLRVAFSKNSIEAGQLTPPKAIRPRTFSTARAPSSVSMTASGALPPSARFGRLSHRVAASRSPSEDF